ncbi:MAG: hypothetical protein HY033_02355 [Ignavibacteriae bacterium]|nr:hypothetical protein [Ignavibacteriota bacterium]
MKISVIALAAIALFSFACTDNNSPVLPTESLVVRHGTSFGMCHRYCIKQIEIAGSAVTYVQKSWINDPHFPEVRKIEEIPFDERKAIVRAVSFPALAKLDTVIGCPDCADGGSEWIEIIDRGYHKKVTSCCLT